MDKIEQLQATEAKLASLKQRARHYQDGMNEGGDGYNPHAAEIRQLEAELDTLQEATAEERMAVIRQAEDDEWTKEVTIERRAAWNAFIKGFGGKVPRQAVVARQQKLGYGTDTLRKHVERHGL